MLYRKAQKRPRRSFRRGRFIYALQQAAQPETGAGARDHRGHASDHLRGLYGRGVGRIVRVPPVSAGQCPPRSAASARSGERPSVRPADRRSHPPPAADPDPCGRPPPRRPRRRTAPCCQSQPPAARRAAARRRTPSPARAQEKTRPAHIAARARICLLSAHTAPLPFRRSANSRSSSTAAAAPQTAVDSPPSPVAGAVSSAA